ncbi:hypothetical protein [Kocuria sp. ZOR0020]|uniref:hypothetical protein n=1 Tax=Kocuria sp. ZOR0020 TaxID=1339234 RepID=UPI0006475C2B|nr:hypothetical protein [Kocuria sp. ZOR0020]
MSTPQERASTQSHPAGALTANAQPCHLDQAATHVAARLLNGAGQATVVCHDGQRGYTLDTVFHGSGADGRRYLVAAPDDDAWPAMEVGRPLRVAMTIKSDAPIAEIRMNTAELTGHVMLTRCSESEELDVLAEGPLPSDVTRTLACWPGAQLWHVEPLRMTAHHVHGSHALDHEALKPRPAWPTPAQEDEVVEAMRCTWGTYLTEIVPHLRAAATVTAAFPDAPGDAHCATGRAYPVAVTDREVAFLMAEGAQRETIVVPLGQTVDSAEALLHRLDSVVARYA